jgi:hypothetical protein
LSSDSRLLVPLLFGILVVATLAGFLIVERERKHPTILEHVHVTPEFEPGAASASGLPSRARVNFLITHSEPRASIVVVDRNDQLVRTLVSETSLPDDSYHHYSWDGSSASGEVAPPGLYRVRVVLGALGRDLPLPSMQLVTAPGGG